MTTPPRFHVARNPARGPAAPLMGLVALAALLTQGGCSSPAGPTRLEVPASQYPAAFEAAKAAIREFRFPLERVDYVNGEITTDQKFSSGIATPWDPQQSTIENEWEDYTNLQGRRVRIRFEPASEASSPLADPPGTQVTATPVRPVSEAQEPVVAQVVVTLSRVNRPGWQPQPKAVRRSGFTEDPELTARRMFPQYQVIVSRDEKLAARIIELMRETLAKSPAVTPASTQTQPETQPGTQPETRPEIPTEAQTENTAAAQPEIQTQPESQPQSQSESQSAGQ